MENRTFFNSGSLLLLYFTTYSGVLQIRFDSRSCQVVTEFLSGDHLKQGLHRADGFAEQVDPINLTQGITFVFKKTPVVFDIKHLV